MSDRDGVQVIGPYLIILQVAKRRALTSNTLSSGSGAVCSVRFAGQGGSTSDDENLPDGGPVQMTGMNDEVPGEPDAGVENTTDKVPSRKGREVS